MINLKLWLGRHSRPRFFVKSISITNIFIWCSSPGLFAAGVKEIRRVYCAEPTRIVLLSLFFEQSFSHLDNLINLELCLVRHTRSRFFGKPISLTNTVIRCSSSGLFAAGVKEIRRMYCDGAAGIVLLSL